MAEMITNQAASKQITPYVDKFLIERDRNIDGQLSFSEFVGNGNNVPTGTKSPATPSQPAPPAPSSQPADISSVLSQMQSTLLQLQELFSGPLSAPPATNAGAAEPASSPALSPSATTTSITTIVGLYGPASSTTISATSEPAAPTSSQSINDMPAPELFDMMDTNDDGQVAYTEIQNFAVQQLVSGKATTDELKTLFDSLDAKADVSEANPAPAVPSPPAKAPADVADIQVTPAQQALFKDIDADSDGLLTAPEIQGFVDQKLSAVRSELDLLAALFGQSQSGSAKAA